MRSKRLLAVVLASCGGSAGAPDAGDEIDSGPLPGPNIVSLHASNADYLRYRDGNGPWLEPRHVLDDEYELNVTEDYEYVVACSDASVFEVSLEALTFSADGDFQFVFCGVGYDEPSTVAVTGQMVQPGSVWMYDVATSETADWSFALDVPPGPHDFFAVSADRIVTQRDQTIDTATDLGSIDVDQDGVALASLPLTLVGLHVDEVVEPQVHLITANDLVIVYGTPTTILSPPSSVIRTSDWQYLFVIATTPTTYRSVSTTFTGTQSTFGLMALPTGVAFAEQNGSVSVTWDPPSSYLDVALSVYTPDGSSQRVSASRSWIETTGATSLAADAMPPDFDPSWSIDPGVPHTRFFLVHDFAFDVGSSAGVMESVNDAAQSPWAPLPSAARAQRRHRAAARGLLEPEALAEERADLGVGPGRHRRP